MTLYFILRIVTDNGQILPKASGHPWPLNCYSASFDKEDTVDPEESYKGTMAELGRLFHHPSYPRGENIPSRKTQKPRRL